MTDLTVAVAQIACRAGDVIGNAALHSDAIAAARERGVELLVFPELSLTDYATHPDVAGCARTVASPELRRLADEAGDMTVSLGFIERAADGRAYNAQALLSGGRCLHVHRKVNLPTYGNLREGLHYAAGRTVEAARLPRGLSVATLICADAWNPALPWLAALQGIDLLIVPVASALGAVQGFDNPGGWDVNLRHTAMTYGLPVMMANHCGGRGDLQFWGGSRILDASGTERARLGPDPGLAVARLDRAEVAAAREKLPTVRDADPALISAELARLLAA